MARTRPIPASATGTARSGSGELEGGPGLRRELGLTDAVLIGLGAMLGAGVFAAFAPAARAAGAGLLAALAVAAAIAYCNATSSAALAAVHPQAGGAYLYGRRQLGPSWGFVAGWGFVIGKTASCAAMALTAGIYAWPEHPRPVAVAAAVALTAVNYLGITRTATLNRLLVTVTVLALGFVIVACLGGGATHTRNLHDLHGIGVYGILQASGLLFFAFAGYARIATLGEEVRDPARTIPRAVPIALGVVVTLYALVGVSILLVLGPSGIAASSAPLHNAVAAGRFGGASELVRVGAAAASLGVLLSAMAGVGRTTLAMARDAELPPLLAAVHPRHRVPHRAELALGALVIVIVSLVDIRSAIGFSSLGVLVYYAIANASAWTLTARSRLRRPIAALGFGGCLLLAATLPAGSVIAGTGLLVMGVAVRALIRRRHWTLGGRDTNK